MVAQNKRSTDLKTNVDTDTQRGEVVEIKIVYCASIEFNILCYYFYTFKALFSQDFYYAKGWTFTSVNSWCI